MKKRGQPLLGEDGRPLIRGVFRPARDWQIEDTLACRGTEGHRHRLKDVVVPDGEFLRLRERQAMRRDRSIKRCRNCPLCCMAPSTWVWRTLLELAASGRQQLRATVPMQESEAFQFELGRVAASLKAARSFHQVQAVSRWAHAITGTLRDGALLAGTQVCGQARDPRAADRVESTPHTPSRHAWCGAGSR